MRPAHPQPAVQPPRIEGYRILELLGTGGMASVWRGIHMSTGRELAIKVLGDGADPHAAALVRFHREVRVMAMLHHPHIARLHSSGVCGQTHFYAMELIDGLPLETYVRERHPNRPQLLGIFIAICRALDYAHQRGVIHGDLKPGNILIDAAGQPHLLDFGLADASASGESRMLCDGEVAGTLEFMSPEQALGAAHPLDARSDIYSLGAVLFLLLTGQSVHNTHGSHAQALRRIAQQHPRHSRELNPTISAKLDTILFQAMQPDPSQRQASAAELADQLESCANPKPAGQFTRALGRRMAKPMGQHADKARILVLAATALAHLRFLWHG